DLPPGTGDIAISIAQLIPNAEIIVVTTPQLAAAEVAERAGSIALQTRQRVVGVVENMSGLLLPDGSTMQVFGEGGGAQVAERLTRAMGVDVPLLGQIPLDPALVAAGDAGLPVVLSAPDSPVGKELRSVADTLSARRRGLAGMSLGLDTSRHLAPSRLTFETEIYATPCSESSQLVKCRAHRGPQLRWRRCRMAPARRRSAPPV